MQPRGIRNNNFGNIEDGPFAQGLPGYAGSDGRFAQFATPQAGMDAMGNLLRSYGRRGFTTPNAIVGRWAPASDGNDVNAYAGFVAKQLGINPDQPINFDDPQAVSALGYAMSRFENGGAAIDAAMKNPNAGLTQRPQQQTAAQSPQSEVLLPSAPQSQQAPREKSWGNQLLGMGSALMSVYDPKGASVLQSMMDPEDAMKDRFTAHYDTNSGRGYRINARTGEVTGFQAQDPKKAPFPQGALNQLAKETSHWAGVDYVSEQAAQIADDLKNGNLDLGLFNQWLSKGKNLAGVSDKQSQAFARWEQFRNLLANEQLLAAKGVQTEGDAYRAMQQFVAGLGAYDNNTARASLENVIAKSAFEARERGGVFIKSYQGQYGDNHPALLPYVKQMEGRLRRYDDIQGRLKAPVPERTPAQAIEQGFPAGVKSITAAEPPKTAPAASALPSGVKSIQLVK